MNRANILNKDKKNLIKTLSGILLFIILGVIILIISFYYLKYLVEDSIYPSDKYFKRVGYLNEARAYHKSFLLSDGKVLIIGGQKIEGQYDDISAKDIDSIEIFDPDNNKFSIVLKDERLKGFYYFIDNIFQLP